MITVQTPFGTKHFQKVVFLWSGHQITGWRQNYKNTYVYNDHLNGVIAFGDGDGEVRPFLWYIPSGAVPLTSVTHQDMAHAGVEYRQVYGDRLIVWCNDRDEVPYIKQWTGSEFVFTPEDLGLGEFSIEDHSRVGFQEWAASRLTQLAGHTVEIKLNQMSTVYNRI